MAETIYVLCGLTSVTCALLLLRGYQRTQVRLLFWSGLCFVGLALNNGIVFADLVAFPDVDLSLPRSLAALCATGLLVFGMVWDGE
jgi:hypothetical protein